VPPADEDGSEGCVVRASGTGAGCRNDAGFWTEYHAAPGRGAARDGCDHAAARAEGAAGGIEAAAGGLHCPLPDDAGAAQASEAGCDCDASGADYSRAGVDGRCSGRATVGDRRRSAQWRADADGDSGAGGGEEVMPGPGEG